ncbi:MAG: hypothetical protein V4857_15335 [Pseudomonadota bacterium]
MNEFERFAYDGICSALAAIDAETASDIYVLSFHVFEFDDDPRCPILQIGYNTRSRWSACTPAAGQEISWPTASNPQEAKWNFAFWLQNELIFIGEPESKGGRFLANVLQANGLGFSDDDEEADFDRCSAIADEISNFFAAMCVRLAQALHASGAMADKFKHPIPIVIHGLDYDDQIAEQTTAANPPGTTEEFAEWISSLGEKIVR